MHLVSWHKQLHFDYFGCHQNTNAAVPQKLFYRAETHPQDITLACKQEQQNNDNSLVHTLERRDGLALILIQCMSNDRSVCQVDLSVWLLLECQTVLHPVFVVSVWEIFSGMGTTRFLSC